MRRLNFLFLLYFCSRAPKPGQNLWFLFDDVADIQKLCDNLHKQGIRESRLKKNLQEKLADVIAATKL